MTTELRRDQYRALAIHGDKKQNERDWVMREFKEGRSQILIATDVAARGLGKVHLTSFLAVCVQMMVKVDAVWDMNLFSCCYSIF